MSSTPLTLLTLVVMMCWTCLSTTSPHKKNPYFDRFIKSLKEMDGIATAASITFAPGLLEILAGTTPPTIKYFKTLPAALRKTWGVYLIILEKDHCRPRVYISSGTSALAGVTTRLKQYDDGFLLPANIKAALGEGYDITFKGMLCWAPIPKAALVPVSRLLFYCLEATFSYVLWAMKHRKSSYSMADLGPIDRHSLEYDGLCSHCCLDEGIEGNFDLDAEELEAYAAAAEAKRIAVKKENATNWHYKQMETNYDEYMTAACARKTKSRAANPGQDRDTEVARKAKAMKDGTYHCDPCDRNFGRRQELNTHCRTQKHRRIAASST